MLQTIHPHSHQRTQSELPRSFMRVKSIWIPPIHTVAMTLLNAATEPPRGHPPGAAGCIAPGAWRRQPPHTRLEMSITTSCSRIPIRSIPLFHAEDIRRDSAHSPRNNDPHGCSHRTAAGAPFRGRRGEWPLQGYSVQSIPSPPCSKEARYNQLFSIMDMPKVEIHEHLSKNFYLNSQI